MATKKFLDYDGLQYFWGKIKTWVNTRLLGKQDTLESGVNIKTVNNESLLGRGNIEIQGGGGTSDYSGLENKPLINSVELSGDKSSSDLGLQSVIDEGHKLPYSYISGTPTIPDVSNYVQKSSTAGLLKNDGTVDTTSYGTYSKPSGGIPASDLASGVIPTVPVTDVTVGGTSVVSSGTAVIPQEVFWATYGTTTAAEIDAAVAAGKVVSCYYNNMQYFAGRKDASYLYFFSCLTNNNYWLRIKLEDSTWLSGISALEISSNKVTSFRTTPDDTHYPSEKLVKDYVDGICGDIQTILISI